MSITKDYFKWQASVLDADYKGSIIEKHHGDTGENRETIVRKWLIKHLPNTALVEIGGKVIDINEKSSKQIDIIIYDNRLPRFGAYRKSYYFAEGVISAIQIKSKIDSSSLSEAIENLASTKICKVDGARINSGISYGNMRSKIPTGIFAFENGYASAKNLLQSLIDYEKKGLSEVNFIFVNKVCYIVYNDGSWHSIDDKTGAKTPLSKGYHIVSEGEDCIWRVVSDLTNEINTVITANYDFQKYFMKTPSAPMPSVSPSPSASPSVSPSASSSPSAPEKP